MGAHPWALAQSVDAAEARWAWRRSGPSGRRGLVHASSGTGQRGGARLVRLRSRGTRGATRTGSTARQQLQGRPARSWGRGSEREAPDLAKNGELGLAGAMAAERRSCEKERGMRDQEKEGREGGTEGEGAGSAWGCCCGRLEESCWSQAREKGGARARGSW